MRKYLLPSALILLLGLGLAVAQTITRAIQLSQDTTGSFTVDTNLGVYFPAHFLITGTNRPPVTLATSVAGNSASTITGTDQWGTVTMGANSATIATVLFGQAFLTVPACFYTGNGTFLAPTTAITWLVGTTSITYTQPATNGNKWNYWCISSS